MDFVKPLWLAFYIDYMVRLGIFGWNIYTIKADFSSSLKSLIKDKHFLSTRCHGLSKSDRLKSHALHYICYEGRAGCFLGILLTAPKSSLARKNRIGNCAFDFKRLDDLFSYVAAATINLELDLKIHFHLARGHEFFSKGIFLSNIIFLGEKDDFF